MCACVCHVCVCGHVYVHVCMSICVHIFVHVSICICMLVCMFGPCIYVCNIHISIL